MAFRLKHRYFQGFTLIELLVVISIVALLSSVVLASLNSARERGRIGGARHFAAQVDHIAGDQAVAMWDFDECSGTSIPDVSGSNVNGIIAVGGPTWSSTMTPTGRGCSLVFDGSDDFVNTTYSAGDQANWTMSAWVYDTKANSTYRAIIQTNNASDDALYIYPGNYLGYWPCNATPSSASFRSNEWVFVTATYDSTIGFKYYLNGVLKGTQNTCVDATDWDFLRIGAASAADGERWQGYMDNVHIFSKTLTASEIERLYASEKAKFELANI